MILSLTLEKNIQSLFLLSAFPTPLRNREGRRQEGAHVYPRPYFSPKVLKGHFEEKA